MELHQPSGPELQTELSKKRTAMSSHRTDLSDHRTDLSEHRTTLSTARSHMANERTQLSYLRTTLSLMSFGITLNRFSIFLRESKMEVKTHGILMQTELIGLGMVVMGIILLGWSLYHYLTVEKDIDLGIYHTKHVAMSFFSIAILLLGGIITVWMFVNRG